VAGTIIWTSPTGRIYRTTPDGAELFPQMRPACIAPNPRKRSRSREKVMRIARARSKIRRNARDISEHALDDSKSSSRCR